MGALPTQLPFGTDRAIGNQFGGTATPDAARVIEPSDLIFEEMDDSPIFSLGEQATCVKRFKVDYDQMQIIIDTYGRGAIFPDSGGRLWRILNIDVNQQHGNYCIVSITSEGINIYIPQPEFNIEDVSINPALQKHPRYSPLNQKFGTWANNVFTAGTFSPIAEVQLAVQQLSSGQGSSSSTALTDLQTLSNFATAQYQNGDLIAQESALELLKKLRRGQDTFYLPGYKITYSTFFPFALPFSNNAPDLDAGGRIEDPTNNTSQVVVPPEYWQDANGNNIFQQLGSQSPQFYYNGVTFLRQADTSGFQRTWFVRNSSWLVGPAGTIIDKFGNIISGGITFTSNDGSQTTTYVWTAQWDVQIYTPLATTNPNYPQFDF